MQRGMASHTVRSSVPDPGTATVHRAVQPGQTSALRIDAMSSMRQKSIRALS